MQRMRRRQKRSSASSPRPTPDTTSRYKFPHPNWKPMHLRHLAAACAARPQHRPPRKTGFSRRRPRNRRFYLRLPSTWFLSYTCPPSATYQATPTAHKRAPSPAPSSSNSHPVAAKPATSRFARACSNTSAPAKRMLSLQGKKRAEPAHRRPRPVRRQPGTPTNPGAGTRRMPKSVPPTYHQRAEKPPSRLPLRRRRQRLLLQHRPRQKPDEDGLKYLSEDGSEARPAPEPALDPKPTASTSGRPAKSLIQLQTRDWRQPILARVSAWTTHANLPSPGA